jgi:CHAD domain-containing protein
MAATRTEEVERKYVVPTDASLPELSGVGDVAECTGPEVWRLEAVYFDTPALDLLRHGVTLRRRVGGSDEGWHLKTPSADEARTETRLPLGRAVHTVPLPLRDAVGHLTAGVGLTPVARLRTVRREYTVHADDGGELARLCDDDVRSERLVAPRVGQRWREWEVELAGAGADLFDRLEPALVEAGARRAQVSSKVARALAEQSEDVEAPAVDDLDERSPASDVLRAYLLEHLTLLREHDAGLRGESVHRLRIAARRLRSALTSYRPLLARGAADDLRDELRWLGRSLGDARDSEVLRRHFDAMADDEPDHPVADATRRRVDAELDEAHRRGHAAAVEAVASDRYRGLVRALAALAAAPPVRGRGRKPAGTALPKVLERDGRRVRRAAAAAEATAPGAERDAALHEVRKKAKRLRYAAESASPALGKPARRLAKRAKAVQEALGAHQDTVASRAWLAELASRTTEADVAFGAGRLHAREEARARSALRDFDRAWERLVQASIPE